MHALLGWNNVVKSAVNIEAVSYAPNLYPAQLQNDQGSPATAYQSTSATNQGLLFDAGVDTAWRVFAMFRTNLSATAQLRWDVLDASQNTLWSSPTQSAGVVRGFGQSIFIRPTEIVGRFAHLAITDPANPDGFINIPLLFAGPVWEPQTNISYDTSFGRDDITDEVVSRGGQEFPTPRFARRRWDVALSGIRQAELWRSAMDLDAYSRTGGNVLFIPDPAGDVNRETVYGRGRSLTDVTYPYGSADRRAWKIRVSERL